MAIIHHHESALNNILSVFLSFVNILSVNDRWLTEVQ
jgi:hypothetical protein